MAAQTNIRVTKTREGRFTTQKVAANTKIYGGSIVVLEGGYAKPGRTATGLIAMGRATETVDNTGGAAGAKTITIERSAGMVEYLYANDTGTAVAQADVGGDCYILDDQTVTGDNTGRSVAAEVCEVVPNIGVWIRFKR